MGQRRAAGRAPGVAEPDRDGDRFVGRKCVRRGGDAEDDVPRVAVLERDMGRAGDLGAVVAVAAARAAVVGTANAAVPPSAAIAPVAALIRRETLGLEVGFAGWLGDR